MAVAPDHDPLPRVAAVDGRVVEGGCVDQTVTLEKCRRSAEVVPLRRGGECQRRGRNLNSRIRNAVLVEVGVRNRQVIVVVAIAKGSEGVLAHGILKSRIRVDPLRLGVWLQEALRQIDWSRRGDVPPPPRDAGKPVLRIVRGHNGVVVVVAVHHPRQPDLLQVRKADGLFGG